MKNYLVGPKEPNESLYQNVVRMHATQQCPLSNTVLMIAHKEEPFSVETLAEHIGIAKDADKA